MKKEVRMHGGSPSFRIRLYSWIIWILAATFLFYKFALEVSPSIMTSQLMRAFRIDAARLGNLSASYYYAYLIMQIPVGILIDRFGPRRVTSLAIALSAFGMMVFGHAAEYLPAFLGRFIIGIGAAFAPINVLKLTANWFPEKRFAVMAGLMMTIGMLGAIGGEAPLALLFKDVGWRSAFDTLSLIGFLLALVFFIIVRDHAKGNAKPKVKTSSFFEKFLGVLKKPQTWLLSIFSGLAYAPIEAFGGLWGVPFLQEKFSIGKESAASSLSLIYLGFAIGAPLFGAFSTAIGKRKPPMFWGLTVALLCIIFILYLPFTSTVLLSTLFILFGFSISSFLLAFTMIHEINIPLLTATALGFMNTFNALFGAVSDPLIGFFLDIGWSGTAVEGVRTFALQDFSLALLCVPLELFAALLCLYFIKETHCKQLHREKI